jgi:hypothetical protein
VDEVRLTATVVRAGLRQALGHGRGLGPSAGLAAGGTCSGSVAVWLELTNSCNAVLL